MRLLESGAVDGTFGTFGFTLIPFDVGGDFTDVLAAMTVDRNGRILVAGSVDVSATDVDFGVARLLADGGLDGDFSGDGRATLAISSEGGFDGALAIAYHTTGIVVGGATWTTDLGGHFNFALARLARRRRARRQLRQRRQGGDAVGAGRQQQRLLLGPGDLARRRDRRGLRRRDRRRPMEVDAAALLAHRRVPRRRPQHLLRQSDAALSGAAAGLATRPPPSG